MLNPFGDDYSLEVVRIWILKDPSVGWGAFLTTVAYILSIRSEMIKIAAFSFLPSFLPSADSLDMGYTVYRENNLPQFP